MDVGLRVWRNLGGERRVRGIFLFFSPATH
jgi:hypothetical protein